MNGSPRIESRNDGGGGKIPVLIFDIKTNEQRKAVYYFNSTIRATDPSDSNLKAMMRNWYEDMIKRYYGNVITLPGNKPDGEIKSDLI